MGNLTNFFQNKLNFYQGLGLGQAVQIRLLIGTSIALSSTPKHSYGVSFARSYSNNLLATVGWFNNHLHIW